MNFWLDKHPGKETNRQIPPAPWKASFGILLCYACKHKKLLDWSGNIISDKEKELEIQMGHEGRNSTFTNHNVTNSSFPREEGKRGRWEMNS